MSATHNPLPLLPGNSFSFQKPSNYRKSHSFDYTNSVPVFHEDTPLIGGLSSSKKKSATSADLYPKIKDLGKSVPAWVAFDRKVLRFHAYFQESVHERREEHYRIRKCNIYFYLEDDSIHVSEPKVTNSGIPQGTLIKRHRIPVPSAEAGQFYTVAEFNVDNEVTFYGRTFKIIGCDLFTRHFLGLIGITVPLNGKFPDDPYEAYRADGHIQLARSNHPKATLKKFLVNDRQVLRFYCLWDDSESAFGDVRDMVLHYFLADDTIEIREHVPPNSGRDGGSLFLRRCRLPKEAYHLQGPGEVCENYYTDHDLFVGCLLDVYGRKFIICDCDEFTKEYYNQRYGIEDFTPIRIDAPHEPEIQAPIPPYNGFGSEEDSLGSCTSLVPKPPKKDFRKLMALDNQILRFSARLNSNRQVDKDRKFVISLYLSDESVQVFEPFQRNSGILGGKFLERMCIKKPQSTIYYSLDDFFIGAELNLNSHKFIINGADEYALKYMEQHSDKFKHSDVTSIETKIGNCLRGKKVDIKFNNVQEGAISLLAFEQLLAQIPASLSKHEVITLERKYGDVAKDKIWIDRISFLKD